MQSQFVSFAEKIGEIYPLQKDQDRILKEIGSQARKITIFAQPLKIDTSLDSIPSWIETVKFSKLKNLEAQKNSFQIEIDNLSKYLPLLYGTGTALEDAVIEALVLLGLKAERTEKGFTADILAQTLDGSKKFGIEVTGTSGAIKKDSSKLTQVMDFERIEENNEKTVLVANTFNNTPIEERKAQENFTKPVLDFLQRHPILLMTGWELYNMVGQVLDNPASKVALVEKIYTTSGRLENT